MLQSNPNPSLSISEQLESMLLQMTPDQIRWAVARQHCGTDMEAAAKCGIKKDTVYHWPTLVRDAQRLMALDGVTTARAILANALGRAAEVKAEGLHSKNERVKQESATELLDRGLGKARQGVDVEGAIAHTIRVVGMSLDGV